MNEGGALQMCAKSTGLSDGWSALGNYEGSIHTVDFFVIFLWTLILRVPSFYVNPGLIELGEVIPTQMIN